jgi:uncharacterized integral membrane protein
MSKWINLRTAPALLALLLLGLFGLQNTQPVIVSFVAWNWTMAKATLVFGAAGLGALVGLSTGLWWRRRR